MNGKALLGLCPSKSGEKEGSPQRSKRNIERQFHAGCWAKRNWKKGETEEEVGERVWFCASPLFF